MTITQRKVVSKLSSFMYHAERYNDMLEQEGAAIMMFPDGAEIKRLPLSDPFWDVGALSHPDEAWAVHEPTKDGIQAYLHKKRASEELGRVARESQQLMKWAVAAQSKLDTLQQTMVTSGMWYLIFFFLFGSSITNWDTSK